MQKIKLTPIGGKLRAWFRRLMNPDYLDINPVEFEGFNFTLAKNQKPYRPLPCSYLPKDNGAVTSAWRLGWRERLRILWTGRIYFKQLTFNDPLQPQRPMVKYEDTKCPGCGLSAQFHLEEFKFNCPGNGAPLYKNR